MEKIGSGIINISDTVIPITLDLSPIDCDYAISTQNGATNRNIDVFILNNETGSKLNVDIPKITLGYNVESKEFVESDDNSVSIPLTIDRVIRGTQKIYPTAFTIDGDTHYTPFKEYILDLIKDRFLNKRIIESNNNLDVSGTLQFTIFPDVGLNYVAESFKLYTKMTIDNGQITDIILDDSQTHRFDWEYASRVNKVSKIRFITTQDTYATLNATYKNIETIL